MMKDVLAIGGVGNIGSYACKTLAAAGYHPAMPDNLVRGHRDVVRWGSLVETDTRAATRGEER